jgi:uncharacterized BrkB/YihY/UPF0761 family membrane protein
MNAEMVRDGLRLFSGIMLVSASVMGFEALKFLYKRVWKQEEQFRSFFGNFDIKEFLAFYLVLWPVLNFVVSGFISYVFHSIF